MENGCDAEQGSTPIDALAQDHPNDVQALVVAPADGSREAVPELAAKNDVAGSDNVNDDDDNNDDDDDDNVNNNNNNYEECLVQDEAEDVYSMDVSDNLVNRNTLVVQEATATTMASVSPLSAVNDSKNEFASESEVATQSALSEISAADLAAVSATAFLKGDVADLNETPKLEPENLREATNVDLSSPPVVDRNFRRSPPVAEDPLSAQVKAEVANAVAVERAASWPNPSKNDPEAEKFAEGGLSDATAFRIVKAEDAKVVQDVDAEMVETGACTGCMSGGEDESPPAVVQLDSKVTNDFEEIGQPSSRTEELSASLSGSKVAGDTVVEGKEPVLSTGGKTELEMEMELFEALEKQEQARLLLSSVDGERQDEELKESQNEKKRALDMPSPERQRKVSRKMHPGGDRAKEEEDVCFICFDGGELVLCDRRSCPKAYHLSCIGRDAAFFKKKGAWLCGWHFCSVCTKPGSFQCYTCPTAYCGSCIGNAEFLLLRNRKGLCEDCLPIVRLIERNETINADGVEVDFEDQDTYECLFKEYWESMNKKLSSVIPEFDKDGKPVIGQSCMLNQGGSETDDNTDEATDESDHDESDREDSEPLGAAPMKTRANKNRMGTEKPDEDMKPENECEGEPELLQVPKSQKIEGWASEELLSFIEHMKEDPTKPLSRFVVNKLLWSYIKRHKLQDSRKSSQINCDERLKSIFGRETVGQFEMIKHLQVHFPAKSSADGNKSKDAQSGEDTVAEDDVVGMDDTQDKLGSGTAKERRRGRRSTDEKFERPDSSEYAAITPKNIDLIYLRRAILRDLLDDPDFDNKVLDTFVRIRVPGISTETETTYRLVLVTGTRIGEESYKVGPKITNIVLEILNLQKKEDVTVDLVSNQDFTEEECQRLRQSIKCGFIKALTVGQVEEKAVVLREAKVNDWFENEKQRLINLRDRASEKGRKKELRECVEKLQELSSPAFRAAKLQARPEVTSDPHMDPGYESDVNDHSPLQGASRKSRPKVSPKGGWEKGAGSGVSDWDSFKPEESVENLRSKPYWEESGRRKDFGRGGNEGGRSSERLGGGREPFGVVGKFYANDERDRARVRDRDWERDQLREQERTRGEGYNWNGNGRTDIDHWTAELDDAKLGRGEARAATTPVFGQSRSEWGSIRRETVPSTALSGSALEFSTTSPSLLSSAALEKEKLWHYQDPTGMVQGPFSMEQLRKWNTTGLFPVNLIIWKTGQEQESSMRLTDALAGRFKDELTSWAAPRSRSRDFIVGESPTARGGSIWGGGGDPGHIVSRTEQGQSAGGAEWDSGDAVERGGNWARGQSSLSGGLLSTGRADDWSGSRSRGESDTWGSGRKGADGSNWGGSEGGKSMHGRSGGSSDREHGASAARGGSRSSRGPRGSKKDVPCRFYAKGYCKRGDACEFWHG